MFLCYPICNYEYVEREYIEHLMVGYAKKKQSVWSRDKLLNELDVEVKDMKVLLKRNTKGL